MGDSAMTIIAIFLAAILMFIFPLMSISERNDDVAQMAVQTSTTEFVDQARTKGVLTLNNYDGFLKEIAATGNSYDVEMEIQRIDENPGKKSAQVAQDKIGENIYYSIYTSQIETQLENSSTDNASKRVALKEGDIFTVKVKNTNQTMAQMFKNFFYTLAGNNSSQIVAQHSGVVTTTGN